MCKYVKYLRVLSQTLGGKGPSYVASTSTIHLLSPSNNMSAPLHRPKNVSPPIKATDVARREWRHPGLFTTPGRSASSFRLICRFVIIRIGVICQQSSRDIPSIRSTKRALKDARRDERARPSPRAGLMNAKR